MIKLVDILHIDKNDFSKYKLHFATGADDKMKPYNKFLIGEFKEWQENQTNKNFNKQYVISLIYYSKNIWMFGGVYEVEQDPKPISNNSWNGWKYKSEPKSVKSYQITFLALYCI